MKIQLPPFVLADLYKNSLVITDDVMPAQPLLNKEDDTIVSWFLGNNNRQVTILVNDLQNQFLDNECLQLLTNMLAALQLTLQDVAVVNINHTPLDYKEMFEKLQPGVCLMFDVTTQQIQLPFMMPDYKVQVFSNCRFLCSASLNKMKGDGKEAKVEKTKLWMSLKTIFE